MSPNNKSLWQIWSMFCLRHCRLFTSTFTTSSSSTTTSSSCNITTLVRTLSTIRSTFHSPQHFPKILLGLSAFSGVCGYYTMDFWYNKSLVERNEVYSSAYHQQQPQSLDQQQQKMKRLATARDDHHLKRRALF